MALTQFDYSQLSNTTFVGMGRNRILNGEMRIDQTNGGAATAGIAAGGVYGPDQFRGQGMAAAGVFTLQRNTATPPTGFTHYMTATCTTADASIAAGDLYVVRTWMEGLNMVDFMLGTATAVTFTLSFRVRSSLTGTYTGRFGNSAANRSYPFEYTINSANTWETKSVTLTGDLTGTWVTDINPGLEVAWSFAVGSTFQGTVNTWQAGNFYGTANQVNFMSSNSARTWDITGIQVEIGASATPFEYRPYRMEFDLCRRFLQKLGGNVANEYVATGQVYDTTHAEFSLSHFGMRTTPTITPIGTTNIQITNSAGTGIASTARTGNVISPDFTQFLVTVASGVVAGNASALFMTTTGSYILVDARY